MSYTHQPGEWFALGRSALDDSRLPR